MLLTGTFAQTFYADAQTLADEMDEPTHEWPLWSE